MATENVPQSGGLKGNLKCVAICFCMALANCQYGYDTASISSFQAMKGFLQVFGYEDPSLTTHGGWGIDTKTQQLITSFLNFGTMFGVIFTGPFARYFGRRSGILAATVIAYAGVSIQLGTTSAAGICVGRALVGASNAFFFTFSNAYVAESSPAHLRSITSGIFGVMPGVGSLLGTITTYLTKGLESKLCYQIPLACLYFFPTILAMVACVVPESPRWLLVQKRRAEAEKALYALRGGSASFDLIQEEFILMARGIEEEEALATSSARFVDIFRGANLLRTVICVAAITSRAASGLWVFLSYGTYYFQQAGISDPFAMQMYTSGAGIAGTALTIWLGYRSLGRRSMVLIGTAAAALSMAGAALGGTIAPGTQEAAKNFVAWSVVYGLLYGGFANMATWIISAEVVSSRLRVHSLALATGIDYIFAWLTAFCSPYFINPSALNWGIKYCWVWSASNALALVFFYFMLPEMKGRSLEEIDELFEKRVPLRQFARYECECTQNAHNFVTEIVAREGTHPDGLVTASGLDKPVDLAHISTIDLSVQKP